VLGFLPAKMSTGMRVEDRLDGVDNFRSWKHRKQLILEENELLDDIKKMLPEPEEKKADQGSLRSHVVGGICQRFNASIAGRWAIMLHNVLTNMRRKRRRSTMHMQLMLKNTNPKMKNLYSFQHSSEPSLKEAILGS
jgi:hypothetical protein